MRFLANENFPLPSISLIRSSGYDVKSIGEEMKGVTDSEVVALAQREDLIILTFDKDYGELIFRHGLSNPPAVIFFRDKGSSPIFAGQLLLRLIGEGVGSVSA